MATLLMEDETVDRDKGSAAAKTFFMPVNMSAVSNIAWPVLLAEI